MTQHQKYTEFGNFLRRIAGRGFFEILLYIQSHPKIHHYEILKYATDKKIISVASLTIFLKSFTEKGILDRKVADTRETAYSVTVKGSKIIKLLKNSEKALR